MTITIDARFQGPDGSANGGYCCGVTARLVGDAAEVTLRLPPPLGQPLRVERADGEVRLLHGDALVAEAHAAEPEVEPPAPVSFAEAEAARLVHGDRASPFPNCFVCGRDRADGMRLFPGPVPGRDLVAAPWVPDETTAATEFVWAALDCPGAYGAGAVGTRGEPLLGRLAARVVRVPDPGERCAVVGWGLGEEGRKVYAGTAVFGEGGGLVGYGRATWILPRA